MRFADVDGVTVDGYGTLLELRDPIPALQATLAERGVERDRDVLRRAFGIESEYYRANSLRARDEDTLTDLRRDCAEVFLAAAGAELDAGEFAPAYVSALVFEPVRGAIATLEALAARGLALALVANWEHSLRHHLREHGLERHFASVVISAEVGAKKPDPRPFLVALDELRVPPARAVHVGDDEVDQRGAAVAGMRFRWAPLATAFDAWT